MSAISGTYFFYRWIKSDQKKHLFTSSLLICLACLVKVVPAFYLFLPFTYLVWQKFKIKMFLNFNLYLYISIIIIPTFAWYFHSYQVANDYGLSFGFGSERFGWNSQRLGIIFEQIIYFIAIRHLLILGFIAMIFGIFCKRNMQDELLFDLLLISNIIYILVFANLNSFHEYYQLCFLIPASVYIGKAFIKITSSKRLLGHIILVIFLSSGSLLYSLEYIAKENPNKSELFELAQIIKQTVPRNSLIISTTGGDPTILYLANRKGWIPSPNEINEIYLSKKSKEGAKYFVGGYNFVQTYQLSMGEKDREVIQKIVSKSPNSILNNDKFFLIKI